MLQLRKRRKYLGGTVPTTFGFSLERAAFLKKKKSHIAHHLRNVASKGVIQKCWGNLSVLHTRNFSGGLRYLVLNTDRSWPIHSSSCSLATSWSRICQNSGVETNIPLWMLKSWMPRVTVDESQMRYFVTIEATPGEMLNRRFQRFRNWKHEPNCYRIVYESVIQPSALLS